MYGQEKLGSPVVFADSDAPSTTPPIDPGYRPPDRVTIADAVAVLFQVPRPSNTAGAIERDHR